MCDSVMRIPGPFCTLEGESRLPRGKKEAWWEEGLVSPIQESGGGTYKECTQKEDSGVPEEVC